ncbi:hypothetical protein AHMF7616_03235 [Adhaeribacter pallidiroseus]|uniref:KAP NTPase domain-containing protein n=1 Tax=Adhaeribacter pallidiroseus TaxID=2072847 RepID=A0A369QP44_9BACT|nr:P-loop NTPase fold protein [Adhaeribacter pallidiroseus]RDC64619.1 hypothetical protein AHMF7616_03235 [Adhaeribacter pallidiroseus]
MGEGKTSVLNFIKRELDFQKGTIIHFTFNPWRFTDEAALLTSFFNTLAKELKDSIPENTTEETLSKSEKQKGLTSWYKRVAYKLDNPKEPLKTRKESIGDIIQKYGKIVSVFGAGEVAETIGNALSNVDVDELKIRIEKLLTDNRKRIIIFIDDIDRLEKTEIHAIFRLVKLTGDFAYTTYVLSFDEHMVASAIGERFGAGDQKAGLNFLEKIVQIPLKLPLAQSSALKDYCFQLVEQSINTSRIEMTGQELKEFANKFSSNYLIRLNTPRLAVRYGNTLSFSLPLLKGEVNYVDLLLVEALRVFYPEMYEFARNQPEYFIGHYEVRSGKQGQEDEKTSKFKSLFEYFAKGYSLDEVANAKGALIDLFPNLKNVWAKGWFYDSSRNNSDSRYIQKRISSNQYFNRYFTYTVIEGDVSDVEFDSLLEKIGHEEYIKMVEPTIKLLKSSLPKNFLQKFRFKEKNFDNVTSVALVKIFGQLGDYFPRDDRSIFGYSSPFSQAAIFISQLIKNQVGEELRFDLVKWIIQESTSFRFAYEVFDCCRNDQDEAGRIFEHEQNKELAGNLIDRAKKNSSPKPIWETYTYESKFMLEVLAIEFDKTALFEYVSDHLELKPDTVRYLLKVFVPFIHSSAHPEPFYGDFNEQSYDWLIKILDPSVIYKTICKLLRVPTLTVETYISLNHLQTDENLIHQFVYWYKNKSELT